MRVTERRYLIFALPGGLYAFDLAQVAEVCELQPTWPIPGAPACYTGALNFHGSIVAVMDLAHFMGLTGSRTAEKVIVLDPGIAALALRVKSVLRIVPESQVISRADAAEERFANARLILPEGVATLLDANAVAFQAIDEICV